MKVLVSTYPYAGHFNPTQPVVKELVRRGHEVVWMTGPTYGYKATTSGAEFVAMSKDHLIDDENIHNMPGIPTLGKVTAYLRRLFLDRIPAQVRDYQAVVDRFPADVMLVDYCTYGASCFSDLTGIPYATLGINPLVTLDPEIPPWATGEQPPRTWFGRAWNWLRHQLAIIFFTSRMTRILNEYRLSLGLERRKPWRSFVDDARSPNAHLIMTTPAFEFPRKNLGSNIKFVGPLMPAYDPRGFTYPDWWAEMLAHPRDKVVHVTQGTVQTKAAALILPTVRALADRDDLLVIVTGRTLDAVFKGSPLPEGMSKDGPDSRIEMPRNVRTAPFIPHLKLLPHVGAMVTNAGFNGVLTALRCGVPLICAGRGEDKADVSSRVQYTGVGLDLRTARPTEKALRRAVLEVVEKKKYREAAARVRDDFATHNGAEEAADELEKLAKAYRMSDADWTSIDVPKGDAGDADDADDADEQLWF